MERIKDIILKNKGIEFVVVVKNEKEHIALRDVLSELNFMPSIVDVPIHEFMDSIAFAEGFANCWRVSETRGVAWNPSILHWRQYYSDIIGINEDGDLTFV